MWIIDGFGPWPVIDRRMRREMHTMRSDLVELITKDERAAKLVHLRSQHEMTRWLDNVTRTTAEVTG